MEIIYRLFNSTMFLHEAGFRYIIYDMVVYRNLIESKKFVDFCLYVKSCVSGGGGGGFFVYMYDAEHVPASDL